mmetsp:Transcript_740/g.1031  ORF Transcript_740/g.1031 Transcript_740/m.1031 type:complete len:140 (+) Transcript_740:121-540(+)
MRRVDRIILASPTVLRTVTSIQVVGSKSSVVPRDWMKRFAPGLRYGNPQLHCDFRDLSAVAVPADGEGDAGEQPEESQESPEATKESESTDANVEEIGDQKEHVVLTFLDTTQHILNLSLYRHSHQLMQRIVELDAEKM